MNGALLPLLTCLALAATAAAWLARARIGQAVPWIGFGAATALACLSAIRIMLSGGLWRSDIGAALWLIVAVCLLCAGPIFAWRRESGGLLVVLCPLLALLGIAGWLLAGHPRTTEAGPWTPWLIVHVAFSLVTFALVTLASVAGLSVLLQSRALKTRSQGLITRSLPSIVAGEATEMALLRLALGLLAIGIATGFADSLVSGSFTLPLDHKTILSLVGFLLIALLIAVHHLAGVRGRRASQLALAAFLALLLAYPGVKFVTEILLAPSM